MKNYGQQKEVCEAAWRAKRPAGAALGGGGRRHKVRSGEPGGEIREAKRQPLLGGYRQACELRLALREIIDQVLDRYVDFLLLCGRHGKCCLFLT